MAEKYKIDPNNVTLADVVQDHYTKDTNLGTYLSKGDFNKKIGKTVSRNGQLASLGNLTIAEAISEGADGSPSPIYKHAETLGDSGLRSFMLNIGYILGSVRIHLDPDFISEYYELLPTMKTADPESVRFWGAFELPGKGQATSHLVPDPEAIEGFYEGLRKHVKANPDDAAIVDAIIVHQRSGQRPSTITELIYGEYYTKARVLGIVPEEIVYVDKVTGEEIKTFELPESKSEQRKALDKMDEEVGIKGYTRTTKQRRGIAKGKQEIHRTKAIIVNVPLDPESIAALTRRLVANAEMLSYREMLATEESRLLNRDNLFIFANPDGTPVDRDDMIRVLRNMNVTYLTEDPTLGRMVEQGILYDRESRLHFNSAAPTAQEVRELGRLNGFPDLRIKTGPQLMRGWWEAIAMEAGLSQEDRQVFAGRKTEVQKIGEYGHPTPGVMGPRYHALALHLGRYINELASPITEEERIKYKFTEEEILDPDIRRQIKAERVRPIIQDIRNNVIPTLEEARTTTHRLIFPNTPNLEEEAKQLADPLEKLYKENKKRRASEKASVKSKEIRDWRTTRIAELGELFTNLEDGTPVLSENTRSNIVQAFTNDDDFDDFWKAHGKALEALGSDITLEDIRRKHKEFLTLGAAGDKGRSVDRELLEHYAKPYKPVPENVRREIMELHDEARNILEKHYVKKFGPISGWSEAQQVEVDVLDMTTDGFDKAAQLDIATDTESTGFAKRYNDFKERMDSAAKGDPKTMNSRDYLEHYTRDYRSKVIDTHLKNQDIYKNRVIGALQAKRGGGHYSKVFNGLDLALGAAILFPSLLTTIKEAESAEKYLSMRRPDMSPEEITEREKYIESLHAQAHENYLVGVSTGWEPRPLAEDQASLLKYAKTRGPFREWSELGEREEFANQMQRELRASEEAKEIDKDFRRYEKVQPSRFLGKVREEREKVSEKQLAELRMKKEAQKQLEPLLPEEARKKTVYGPFYESRTQYAKGSELETIGGDLRAREAWEEEDYLKSDWEIEEEKGELSESEMFEQLQRYLSERRAIST